MPIPILFVGVGVAALTGATGLGGAITGGVSHLSAKKINKNSNERIEAYTKRLDELRFQCGHALQILGEEKIFILDNNINRFVSSFKKIKNIDFVQTDGISETEKFKEDMLQIAEMEKMSNFAASLAKGTAAGVVGGALFSLGAYSLAANVATASTGIAIHALSGAAATNATLAFFGGGSLAAGGLGMAAGTAVLGGLVAGPALCVMGLIVGAKGGKNLEKAKTNAAQTTEACEQMQNGIIQCIAIRDRTFLFYELLTRLDSYFLPMLFRFEELIEEEGCDYAQYSDDSKKFVASVTSLAVTIKAVLDTPILTEDGNLTEESGDVADKVSEELKKNK